MKWLLLNASLLSLLLGYGVYEYSRLPEVAPLKRKNPRTTAMMELRDEEYRKKREQPVRRQIWVPFGAISENLRKAVVLSEDAAFFSHKGVDYAELKEAIREDWERGAFKRGGSTITMQLARNLYLDPSKNPLRKLREIAIAYRLEKTLSKQRIFELYLNVAEWGPGVYGAEAAARHYFSKPASALNEVEAATLAALLPSPRNPGYKGLRGRRNLILTRFAAIGHISYDDLERAKNEPLFRKAALPAPDRSEPAESESIQP